MKKLNTLILGCAATFGSICHANAQAESYKGFTDDSKAAVKHASSFNTDRHVKADTNGRFNITSYQHEMNEKGFKVDSVKSTILRNSNYPETVGDTILRVYSWIRGMNGILQVEDILAHPKNSKMPEYDMNDITMSNIYYIDNTGPRVDYHMEKDDSHKPTAKSAIFLSTAKFIGYADNDIPYNNRLFYQGHNTRTRKYLLDDLRDNGYDQMQAMKRAVRGPDGTDDNVPAVSNNRYNKPLSVIFGYPLIFNDATDKKDKINLIPQL